MRNRIVLPFVLLTYLTSPAHAGERVTLANVEAPSPIVPNEPLARKLSLANAVHYLDSAALHWQKQRKCGTCHTNFIYLVARPVLSSVSPQSPEVRAFFELMVEKRWPDVGPRWDAEVVVAATTLAFNDRQTTGRLHPTTRKALDRMWTLQRPDGGWDWLKCGWPPMESDDHYGVTFAALGVGIAPGGYAETEVARQGLEGIRHYLKNHPPPSLHHKSMVLWASLGVDGLMSEAERRATLDEIFPLQLPDGGWAIARLLEGWKDHQRKDDEPQDTKSSDGYATRASSSIWRARRGSRHATSASSAASPGSRRTSARADAGSRARPPRTASTSSRTPAPLSP